MVEAILIPYLLSAMARTVVAVEDLPLPLPKQPQVVLEWQDKVTTVVVFLGPQLTGLERAVVASQQQEITERPQQQEQVEQAKPLQSQELLPATQGEEEEELQEILPHGVLEALVVVEEEAAAATSQWEEQVEQVAVAVAAAA